MKFTCELCEKTFDAMPSAKRKFCSYDCYWKSKKHHVIVKCDFCGKPTKQVPSFKGKQKFCSRKCFHAYYDKSVNATCGYCGKPATVRKSRIPKSGNYYCSRKCSSMAVSKPGWRKAPSFKLHTRMASEIRQTISGQKRYRKWEDLVGYTTSQLKRHLEKQFTPGMTWQNHTRTGWHIDHIIPRTAFNFTKPEHPDFKKCWALKNLRPLWYQENISKSNKLMKPFQPSLALEPMEARA